MARFLRLLGQEAKAAPVASPTGIAVGPRGIPTYQQGRYYDPGWDMDRAVRDGLERVIAVFAAVRAIAGSSARLPCLVRSADRLSGKPIPDHPLVPLLNAYPNRYEDARQFRFRLQTVLLLSRLGAMVEVEKANDGTPLAFSLLPPAYTKPIPGKSQFLDGFMVRVPGTDPIIIPPERVLWFREPHPTDPYASLTPLEAAGLSADIDFYARLYNRNFMARDGRPALLVGVRGDVSEDDAAEIKSRFSGQNSGPAAAGRSTVIELGDGANAGIDVKDLALNPRDMQYAATLKHTKEDLLGAFRTPESVAYANSSGKTFANAEVDYRIFWEVTMPDYLDGQARVWDRLDQDPSTFVDFDVSTVAVLARAERQIAIDDLKAGGSTLNEYRDAAGRAPYDSGGDSAYLPNNLVSIATLASSAAEAPPSPTAPEPVKTLGPYALEEKALTAERRARDKKIRSWETHVQNVVRGSFKRQRRVTLEKLRAAKSLKFTRHWVRTEGDVREPALLAGGAMELKVLAASDVYDVERWRAQLSEDADAYLTSIVEDFGTETFDAIASGSKALELQAQGKAKGAGPHAYSGSGDRCATCGLTRDTWRHRAAKADTPAAFHVHDKRVIDLIFARRNKVAGASDTTYDAIKSQLAAGEAGGETIDELASRVASVFDAAEGVRSSTIARTEVISAANGAATIAAEQTGLVKTKSWLATLDERTRDSHDKANGQTVDLSEDFSVGDATLRYPGDPDGPAEEVVNCFPADTLVEAPLIELAFRRWYDGPMVTVRTRQGRMLTGTPNHPVLTGDGWVTLGSLHQGDDLVCASLGQGMSRGDPDVEHRPALLGEYFSTALPAGTRQWMEGDPRDFHGDGRQGQVDVVGPDRILRKRIEATDPEHVRELALVGTDYPVPADVQRRPTPGSSFDAFGPVDLPATSDVRGGDLFRPLHGGHALPLRPLGLRSSPGFHARGQESVSNDVAADPERVREGLLRLAGDVSIDEVLHVQVNPFSGHVFNLQTVEGWYLAYGIVSSNCRCTVIYGTGSEAFL